eukprot:scaffold11925_cov101-Isochrysis_galbana.AAC.4
MRTPTRRPIPPPPTLCFVPARRGRGRAGHVSRGSASARGDMDLVYSRGEGRLGEETSQLAVRGRLSRIFRLAYAASGVDRRDLPDTKGEGWRTFLFGGRRFLE